MTKPETVDVEVAGGLLRALVYRPEGEPTLPPVFGIHGITGSALQLQPVARDLVSHTLVAAPDLRGRGVSGELPPPYSMTTHADDCAAVLRALGLDPVIVVGESMGGYVAAILAAKYPELVRAVVLVDGGPMLPLPDGVDPDTILTALLGPSIARLAKTFASVDEYFDYWRVHPALGEGWSADVEDYLRYDLTGEEPKLRSRVSAAAVEGDFADQVNHPEVIIDSLASLKCPVHLIRATRGLQNEPSPLLPQPLIDLWCERLPQLTVETVDDTNHYTLMFGDRGVSQIVKAVRSFA
ncbi:MAG: alpha/beta fold hydrolase [Mycobacteriales bacterium]